MSKYYSNRKKKYMSEMNVVPFIDVMLVLLVIFMVATPLLNQGLDIDLPETATSSESTSEPVRTLYIDINRQGEYAVFFDGDDFVPITENEAIVRAVAANRQSPDARVILRADREVSHGTVLGMLSQLQAEGLESVTYAVQALGSPTQ